MQFLFQVNIKSKYLIIMFFVNFFLFKIDICSDSCVFYTRYINTYKTIVF